MISMEELEAIYDKVVAVDRDHSLAEAHRLALLAVYDKGWGDGNDRGYTAGYDSGLEAGFAYGYE